MEIRQGEMSRTGKPARRESFSSDIRQPREARGPPREIRGAAVPLVFFFQAEDGIRDVAVTGVQTCALPILLSQIFERLHGHRYCSSGLLRSRGVTIDSKSKSFKGETSMAKRTASAVWEEIGRASCRERV